MSTKPSQREFPMMEGPRSCTKEELPQVVALADRVMREGGDQSFLTDYPLVYEDQNLANIFIQKVGGEVASVVPFLPHEVAVEDCCFSVGVISPTATDRSHRKKGHSLRCLQKCIAKMQQDRVELSVLWTLTPTFKFYEHANYQGVDSQGWICPCGGSDADVFADHGEETVEYDPKDMRYLDDLQRMHEQDGGGIVRDIHNCKALFSLPKVKTLIALREGLPVGYLVVSRATNKPGLLEAGGCCEAVETLLHRTLQDLAPQDALDAYAYRTPSALGDMMTKRFLPRCQPLIEGPMMVRINDARGFFRGISSWLEKRNEGRTKELSLRISDTDEIIGLSFPDSGLKIDNQEKNQHAEVTLRQLTGILFGPHPEHPFPQQPEFLSDFFHFISRFMYSTIVRPAAGDTRKRSFNTRVIPFFKLIFSMHKLEAKSHVTSD